MGRRNISSISKTARLVGAAIGITLAVAGCELIGEEPFGKDPALTEIQAMAHDGDAAAQTALGQRYEAGNGIVQDPDAAFTWYERAAQGGDPLGQFLLGQMYENGTVGQPDYLTAAEWYMRAAAQGEAAAQAGVARLYEQGYGVPQNYDKAASWYSMAAVQWDAAARYPFGAAYATGRPRSGNAEEAVKWFQRAAQLGVAEAQFDLGRAFELGQGVGQNFEAAQSWYREAAEQGHDRAAEAVARLSGLAPESTPATGRVVGDLPPRLRPPGAESELPALDGPGAPMRIAPDVAAEAVGGAMVHLASYRKIEDADAGWGTLLAQHGDLLRGLQLEISRVDLPEKGTFFRVQAGPLQSLDAARRLCAQLEARAAYCQAVNGGG